MKDKEKNIILEARDIEKTFVTGTRTLTVLKGLVLSIKQGEIISITGVSGAGKSTLLHILGALDPPTAGEVIVNNILLTELKERKLAEARNKSIGFIFQFHHLMPEFTSLENVCMPLLINRKRLSEAKDIAEKALEEVGLKDRMQHKPTELSGGEQQRVAVARALVNQPQIVLGDEPTGNLDTKTSEELHEILWGLNESKGMTFVIVTHDEALAQRADRQFRLEDGKLREI